MDDAEAIEYISIHAPARGSDDCCKNNTKMSKNFNPRSPQGGATEYNRLCGRGRTYFNPRSPQGGATYRPTKKEKQGYISIHAPRKGERLSNQSFNVAGSNISIHAPRKGERRRRALTRCSVVGFQSTLPSWDCPKGPYQFQSTLPTRGERLYYYDFYSHFWTFQSTLPTRGSDHPP